MNRNRKKNRILRVKKGHNSVPEKMHLLKNSFYSAANNSLFISLFLSSTMNSKVEAGTEFIWQEKSHVFL